ncbi:hypothetical protein [uncultured Tenacibaculum sp.]|uniref:hypothetical protein n=1 Tax=uncultured Tenacibaculum sp. TaxID=174713 RepID=UPI00262B905C|nr:hypothetical protein [uncultured Tenacibaculum sp.]
MNSLKDRKNQIVNFWDIEEETEREKLIEEIRNYSEIKSEIELVSEIRENFEQINFSGISVIYEALSKNPKKWSNFFKEEYERAFESAKKSNNAFEILESLQEISFVEKEKLETLDEIITLLENNLSHSSEVIRYKSIWYLSDWISNENKHKYSHIILKITSKLQDENWKIRYATKLILEDMNKLPKDYKVSFWDKVKIKFGNPFKI